jgi:hypothetical protein
MRYNDTIIVFYNFNSKEIGKILFYLISFYLSNQKISDGLEY